ncbi:uncharacterized protein RJT21DRAFT_12354 [Scheffersomyces amazonensis]|uniref:uncharacterized protein n=1 Tax=Scheffersomyces amazonensis TaxID=1078765 RepID=UPI00315C8FAE
MNLTFIIALFLSLWFVQAAETTSSSSSTTTTQSPTLVWATGTNSLGVTVTTQSQYTQQFYTLYSTVAPVLSGSIGLGSDSDTQSVGDIRTYAQITISNAAGGSFSKLPNIESGRYHYFLAIFGLFVVPLISTVLLL